MCPKGRIDCTSAYIFIFYFQFHFENSKSARSLFRTDFDGEMDDFNEKLSAAAVLSNTAFINLVIKETGVASKKRQLLGKCLKKVSILKLLYKGCPKSTRTGATIRHEYTLYLSTLE